MDMLMTVMLTLKRRWMTISDGLKKQRSPFWLASPVIILGSLPSSSLRNLLRAFGHLSHLYRRQKWLDANDAGIQCSLMPGRSPCWSREGWLRNSLLGKVGIYAMKFQRPGHWPCQVCIYVCMHACTWMCAHCCFSIIVLSACNWAETQTLQ